MSIFNSPIPQQEQPSEQQPHRWSEQLALLLRFLLGRTPLRRLSQSLIIILMLISPLSFSTDKISNFTYECPVSHGCSIRETSRSAILSHNPHHQQIVVIPSIITHPLPVPQHPPQLHHASSPHSRAPPA